MFLTKYASHVTCLVRGDDFSCAKATADEARNHPDITVRTHTVVESVEGDGLLRRLTCRDTETGEVETMMRGRTRLASSSLPAMNRRPNWSGALQTSIRRDM